MSVINATAVQGLDAATFDQLVTQLDPSLQAALGIRSHLGYPCESGWTVVGVCDSEEQLPRLFDANVKPGLPPTVVDLSNVVSVRGD